jgi:uncharacterized protein YndB with AHSA1/START domain
MTPEFSRSFSVSAPVERAWQVFTEVDELNKWYFPVSINDVGQPQHDVMGQPTTMEILEVTRPHTLRYRSPFGPWPIDGTVETSLTFESIETGTRITLTRSGFGEGEDWESALNAHILGTEDTLADAVLYLETGVAVPRHPSYRCWVGFAGHRVPAGVQVHKVAPGAFAGKAGLQRGDLVVGVGGVAVFDLRDIFFFEREHRPGELTEVAWIRDGQLLRSTAELGPHLAPSGAA